MILVVLAVGVVFLTSSAVSAACSYTVQPGDSLFFIGQRFAVSVDELKAANGIWRDTIYTGEVLYVPDGHRVGNTYTVKPGDSLFLIGQRFGVSVADLKAANCIWADTIYAGEVLTIPGNSSGAGNTYTVQPGDSLYFIGQRFGVSVADLKAANGLWSDIIYVGEVLYIPAPSAPAPPSSGNNSWRNYSDYELDLLARVVYSEARGEPYEGQVAVAAVVLNRVYSPGFPWTIEGVVFEPWAFTAVNDGQFWLTPNGTAYSAAQDALNGWDPSGGALYYFNPVTATSPWIWTRTVIKQIGNHLFAI